MQHPWVLDEANTSETQLYIDIPSRTCSVEIHLTDDGIIVNVWPAQVADEPVATCWASKSELAPE